MRTATPRSLALLVLILAAILPGMRSAAHGQGGGSTPAAGFYFGRIAFENAVVGIALHRQRQVKVLVTDAEPGGIAEWFQGRVRGLSLDLRSATRQSRLQATFDPSLKIWNGTITLPNGRTRAVATNLAGEGAGIYDITVRRGRFTGESTQGHRYSARQEGGYVVGTLIERSGNRLPFKVRDLSQAFAYTIPGGQPDRYTVIVSRNGTLHYGRGGRVKQGRPDRNLIALDIQPSDHPTPGFYFGKVAFERDVIGVQLGPPNAEGVRTIRAYMSDSEPEPEGDLQWFTGSFTGSAASLTSVTGDAQLEAVVTEESVEGVVALPGNRMRRFFALAAGEGAGIYDVTVGADGSFQGTSEHGGTLEGHQDGIFVHLVITAPDGAVFESHPNDLTRALLYPVVGNQPDTYVAIVAPRGRFVFGRSGAVRIGRPGLNIIGLDKAC